MARYRDHDSERSPLLNGTNSDRELVTFAENDASNPRNWPKWKKLSNITIIALQSLISPLASSMFTPGIDQMAESLKVPRNSVIACQTGYVIMLGIGPLILAPLSETLGRKPLYLTCFTAFTILQIPTALSKSLPFLVAMRTLAGLFGSVSIANGGGTIGDMYQASERAGIFGIYLLGPLIGPTIGPLLGSVILNSLDWPWLFWILTMICGVITTCSFLFLRETYAPVILAQRKRELEEEHGKKHHLPDEDTRPVYVKILESIRRPLRILFTQPIVMTMAAYQALIFATVYSLYTQFQPIYGDGYGFTTIQVGLAYIAPGVGYLFALMFLVPRIGTVYNTLTEKHDGVPLPEYRLPLANIGAILIPASIFSFAWLVENHIHWASTMAATFCFGIGQVVIFNSVQNYYIDSYERYAASAIAAGALFRSLVGGIIPLFTPLLLDKYGVGWGLSIFGFVAILLAPSPLLFYYYGASLRKRFAIEL